MREKFLSSEISRDVNDDDYFGVLGFAMYMKGHRMVLKTARTESKGVLYLKIDPVK